MAKKKSAGGLLSRQVNNKIDESIDGCVDEWIYLTGEQVSINAHQKELLLAISSQ